MNKSNFYFKMAEDYPQIKADSKCFYCNKNIFTVNEYYTNCCCGCTREMFDVHICYFDVDLLEIKQINVDESESAKCPLPGCDQLLTEKFEKYGGNCCGCVYFVNLPNEHSH